MLRAALLTVIPAMPAANTIGRVDGDQRSHVLRNLRDFPHVSLRARGYSWAEIGARLLRDIEDAAQSYRAAIWPGQIAGALRALIQAANLARQQGLAAVPATTWRRTCGCARRHGRKPLGATHPRQRMNPPNAITPCDVSKTLRINGPEC